MRAPGRRILFTPASILTETPPLLKPAVPEQLLPVKAKRVLSDPEKLLYGRLVRALPGHIVFAKVAVSQLLNVEREPSRGRSPALAHQLRQWVADFVVCASDFTVAAVIQLDRRAQQRDAQRVRDAWKAQLLQAAGIRVFRVPVADIPNEAALKALLALRQTHSGQPASQALRQAS